MATNIICGDPLHSTRNAEPDWADVIGTVPEGGIVPTRPMLCEACVRLNYESVEGVNAHKKQRIAEVDARSGELIGNGFEFPPGSGMCFSLSENSQRMLLGTHASRDDPQLTYPLGWNTKDDEDIYEVPDSATLHNFYLVAFGTIRAYRDSGTAIKNQIRAATTHAEIDVAVDER